MSKFNSKFDLDAVLFKFLAQLQANGRSANTIGQYARHIRALGQWLEDADVRRITHEDLATFLASPVARLRSDGSPKKEVSMNTMRTSLRVFFSYLHKAGFLSEDPARLIQHARCSGPPPRALTEDEQERLLAVLDNAPDRDRILFTLMLRTGLRLGSAVGLDVEDLELAQGQAWIRGKGNREERVYLPEDIQKMLGVWVGARASGPLFSSRTGRRITARHAGG